MGGTPVCLAHAALLGTAMADGGLLGPDGLVLLDRIPDATESALTS
ncbi:hypothetical protein [Streptomyces neyagawaensis]|nr:hypothetical protein [Streptomyces neyagawaensis]MCL6731488.1 hypothetical protein [Streptomyces neyagawaensis]MDE1688799.1 hypothetical protein [Streptomyces neyagawaensis]